MAGKTSYYHCDASGNVRALTDSNQNVRCLWFLGKGKLVSLFYYLAERQRVDLRTAMVPLEKFVRYWRILSVTFISEIVVLAIVYSLSISVTIGAKWIIFLSALGFLLGLFWHIRNNGERDWFFIVYLGILVSIVPVCVLVVVAGI